MQSQVCHRWFALLQVSHLATVCITIPLLVRWRYPELVSASSLVPWLLTLCQVVLLIGTVWLNMGRWQSRVGWHQWLLQIGLALSVLWDGLRPQGWITVRFLRDDLYGWPHPILVLSLLVHVLVLAVVYSAVPLLGDSKRREALAIWQRREQLTGFGFLSTTISIVGVLCSLVGAVWLLVKPTDLLAFLTGMLGVPLLAAGGARRPFGWLAPTTQSLILGSIILMRHQ